MPSIALGCDPGLSGALAFLDETSGRIVGVHDMPTAEGARGQEVDFLALVAIVERYQPRVAVTEDVWGVAGCGAKSSFTFGAAYGCLIGAFRYMRRPPLQRVRPQTWQSTVFGYCDLGDGHDTKRASVFCALKLHPEADLIRGKGRKPDHNRSDAVCIAHYAYRVNPNTPEISDRTRKAGK